MDRPLVAAATFAALFLVTASADPAAAKEAGRIRAGGMPPVEGVVMARFAVGTGEGMLGAHRDPDGSIPYGLFNGPASFAVEGGTVHILDTLNRRVVRAPLGGPGPLEQAKLPKETLGSDLALEPAGYAIADAAGPRILRIDRLGKPLASIGGPGDGDGLFRQADLVGFDAAGNVLVVDWGRGGEVSRFDPKGLFLGREKPGTATFVDGRDKRLRIEFHADTGQFALFRATASGETEDALFKMEGGGSGGNLDVVGIDAKDRVYLKRFRPPELEILRLDPTGKTESRHPAPLDPGFDLSRPFAVDRASGDVYALVFRDGAFAVLKLPAASARAN